MSNQGKDIFAEAIEQHYCKSAFVKEICVIGPHALVVPDMDLMRARKITNIGDLLRFEIEGLSHLLPEHERVLRYDVSFDPLPRTPAQEIERNAVARLLRQRQDRAQRPDASMLDDERAWLAQPGVAAAVAAIEARAKGGRAWPDANLEIDLGFDSMQRVEMLMALEAQFSANVSQQQAAEIFTVKQLVDALRASVAPTALALGASTSAPGATADPAQPWAAILGDLPAASDPHLGWLLRRRAIAAPVLFVLVRIARVLLVRVNVKGLDRLPASGPYLITPNHQSYIDPFILCGVLPYRVFKQLFFVGAIEYFETPLTRWAARKANVVPVDPDSNLVPAMQAAAFGLVHGKILMLFPEGERSIDGTVKKFKKGAPILAQHLAVPMVPVALKGIYEMWPRGRAVNWRKVGPWSGHRVLIEIGAPVTAGAGLDNGDSASRLRDRVNAMWEALST
jgi:long-chain acyl-CoA synthetase